MKRSCCRVNQTVYTQARAPWDWSGITETSKLIFAAAYIYMYTMCCGIKQRRSNSTRHTNYIYTSAADARARWISSLTCLAKSRRVGEVACIIWSTRLPGALRGRREADNVSDDASCQNIYIRRRRTRPRATEQTYRRPRTMIRRRSLISCCGLNSLSDVIWCIKLGRVSRCLNTTDASRSSLLVCYFQAFNIFLMARI